MMEQRKADRVLMKEQREAEAVATKQRKAEEDDRKHQQNVLRTEQNKEIEAATV